MRDLRDNLAHHIKRILDTKQHTPIKSAATEGIHKRDTGLWPYPVVVPNNDPDPGDTTDR